MAGEIVPFGKYRGKPMEALAQDKQYVDWLTAQPWFREKFGNMYTLIVNNFQEPAETPEHNKLQVLFLDDAFRNRFLVFILGTQAERVEQERIERVKRSAREGQPAEWERAEWERERDRERSEWEKWAVILKDSAYSSSVDFEVDGFDVRISIPKWTEAMHVEIKPTIGDDYPAVLRQMKGARDRQVQVQQAVLFLTEYTGTGATCEQFIEIFETAGIKIVFLDEVA